MANQLLSTPCVKIGFMFESSCSIRPTGNIITLRTSFRNAWHGSIRQTINKLWATKVYILLVMFSEVVMNWTYLVKSVWDALCQAIWWVQDRGGADQVGTKERSRINSVGWWSERLEPRTIHLTSWILEDMESSQRMWSIQEVWELSVDW